MTLASDGGRRTKTIEGALVAGGVTLLAQGNPNGWVVIGLAIAYEQLNRVLATDTETQSE